MTSRIVVVAHKGHSGKSVYGWRVYRVTQWTPTRVVRTQLAKCRSQSVAIAIADAHIANDLRIAALRRKRDVS